MAHVPEQVEKLVELFDRNIDTCKSQGYNEAQLRVDFINPFWNALGWDVENKAGRALAYRNVVYEDAIKVGTATKAPDYCFRIGGTRKFFVETKHPARNLKEDPSPAFQLRRYAWSAKLPLSILTDFEEMTVYDCRMRPVKTDKASKACINYIKYIEYSEKWGEIESVFSLDAVLKGSFDKYAETTGSKRGTAEVDTEFLKEIEGWRDVLARNIALRNRGLSVRDLNFAVQMTIDRIIFLRMCEDRGIEKYGMLQALCGGPRIYPRLLEIYRNADERYNSGLFHFEPEKDRDSLPDELTPKLTVDDKVLKGIFQHLYYPDSPYEFRILPPEILGNVYEQFLGKIIRLTKTHQAKVEEKPEVRKAGGVYYTPKYIVDYIVKNTVGKLLGGDIEQKIAKDAKGEVTRRLTPHQASRLRILDPACGSGSFLIGAYQYLLDWHLKYYLDEMEKTGKVPTIQPEAGKKRKKSDAPVMFQGRGGDWLLTTIEKKRILLNNIYGVDIDAQAVEVTKLSLLLKVLENENQDTLQSQLSLWRERALPDLSSNIKCGNSLIGPDFYEGMQMDMFDEEARYRINAFDWNDDKHGFGEIMRAGGFDAVIGNPPYIRIQAMKEWAPVEVEHYKQAYEAASKGNYDIYVVFVEKGLNLLNLRGRLGFILPHKFFNAKYGEPLRAVISDGRHLSEIVHFGDKQVFSGASTYTCLLFLDNAARDTFKFKKVEDLPEWCTTAHATEGIVACEKASAAPWNFVVGRHAKLFEKLCQVPEKLGGLAHLFVGLQTDADDVFIMEQVSTQGDRVLCRSRRTGREHWFEDRHLKSLLKGSLNIRRYHLADVTKRLIFPYETRGEQSVLIGQEDYAKRFPLTWAYLQANRQRLTMRNKGKIGDDWHGYVYKKNHTRFGLPKLLVPSIATGSCFAADLEGRYYFVGSGGGGGGGYAITFHEEDGVSPLYYLGLLNSRLLSEYLKNHSTPFRGGYVALNRQYIEQLPIRTIDFSKTSEVEKHDRMVALVESMLDLNKKLPAAKTPHEKTRLERQISATDNQIDALVYELYELTEQEIKIVEGER